MSDVNFIHCPSCNWPYLPGEALYCTKCGDKLSRSINPAEEIKRLESEPKPYEALRFTSGLVILLGWLVIVFGWLVAITFGSGITASVAKYVVAQSSALQNLAVLVTVVIGVLHTIFGIMLIAMGQVFAVMLDIRNDTHVTMRLVRRFGLLMSEK